MARSAVSEGSMSTVDWFAAGGIPPQQGWRSHRSAQIEVPRAPGNQKKGAAYDALAQDRTNLFYEPDARLQSAASALGRVQCAGRTFEAFACLLDFGSVGVVQQDMLQ